MKSIFLVLPLMLAGVATAGPGFRAMMADVVFEQRFQQLLADVDLEALDQAASTPEGAQILTITPGGQADRLGIKEGDCVISVAGNKIWRGGQDWKKRESNREIVILGLNGEHKTYPMEPGMFGVSLEHRWGIAREHVAVHGTAGPAHDLVIGAVAVVGRDPDVAEAALHRAFAAGYRGEKVAAALGIEIAIRQNRPGVAWEFAQQLLDDSGKASDELEPGYRLNVVRAAIANGRMEFLKNISKLEWGPAAIWTKEEILKQWDELPAPEHEWAPAQRPSQRLNLYGLRDRTPVAEMIDDGKKKPWAWPQRRNLNQEVAAKRGYWNRGYQGIPSGLRDCVWELNFTATRTPGNEDSYWGSVVRMFLRRLGEERDDDHSVASISLATSSDRIKTRIETHASGLGIRGESEWEWSNPRVRIRLIKLGNEVEIQLDGNTVLWAPVEAAAENMGIQFFLSGMTVESHKWRLYEIVSSIDEDEVTL